MQQDTQGRLLIGLTSNPMKGTLEGTVFEANNLTKQDVFGLAGKFHHPHKEIHMASKGLNTAFLCTSTRAHNEG
jgi:hypothetical protein